jgi:hypothetical protein
MVEVTVGDEVRTMTKGKLRTISANHLKPEPAADATEGEADE